jgi:hypothetical protein
MSTAAVPASTVTVSATSTVVASMVALCPNSLPTFATQVGGDGSNPHTGEFAQLGPLAKGLAILNFTAAPESQEDVFSLDGAGYLTADGLLASADRTANLSLFIFTTTEQATADEFALAASIVNHRNSSD